MPRHTSLQLADAPLSRKAKKPLTAFGKRLDERREELRLDVGQVLMRIAKLTDAEKAPAPSRWWDWTTKFDPLKMEVKTLLNLARALETSVEQIVDGGNPPALEEAGHEQALADLETELASEGKTLAPTDKRTLQSVRFYGRRPTRKLLEHWLIALDSLAPPRI